MPRPVGTEEGVERDSVGPKSVLFKALEDGCCTEPAASFDASAYCHVALVMLPKRQKQNSAVDIEPGSRIALRQRDITDNAEGL